MSTIVDHIAVLLSVILAEVVVRIWGDRLIARAQSMGQRIGCVSPMTPQPLAGFSHGAAGMVWAL